MAVKSNGARGSNGSNGHRVSASRERAGYAVDDGRVMDQTRRWRWLRGDRSHRGRRVAGADAQLRSLDTASPCDAR